MKSKIKYILLFVLISLPFIFNQYIGSFLYTRSFNDEYYKKLYENYKSLGGKFVIREIPMEYHHQLYQLMKDIHDVFEIYNLKYWIDGGTLLGSIRHKGIIPWDDDLDIQIHENDFEKFLKVCVPALKHLGYDLVPELDGIYEIYKIVKPYDPADESKKGVNPPFCDVFIARPEGEYLKLKGWKHGIKISDLKPLKLYDFGPLKVWGCANPYPYLRDLYGDSWHKIAWRGFDHYHLTNKSTSYQSMNIENVALRDDSKVNIVDNKHKIKGSIKNIN